MDNKDCGWPPLSSKTMQTEWCDLCVHQVMVRDEVDIWPWCNLGYEGSMKCKKNLYKDFKCSKTNQEQQG